MMTSSKYLKSYQKNSKMIKKTAFFVFSYSVFNHFKPIIEINPNLYEILVKENFDHETKQKIRNDLNDEDFKIRYIDKV